MPTILVALALAPPGDALAPERATTRERDLLPSGGHLASLADTWWLQTTPLHSAHNGLALFDPVRLSAHGRSWTQTRFFLNEHEITDPALPGQPLIEIPQPWWEAVEFASLWTPTPGITWRLAAAGSRLQIEAGGRWGTAVGGGTWIPAGLMDREPALRTGADPTRRALTAAPSGYLDWRLPWVLPGRGRRAEAASRVAVEHLEHSHTYPTLRDRGDDAITEQASRTTVLGGARLRLGQVPVELLAVYQSRGRTHAGAEARLPELLTHRQNSDAVVAQAASVFCLPRGWRLALTGGFGWRRDRWQQNGHAPQVFDLAEQWNWLARPRFGERLERHRLDVAARAQRGVTQLSLTAFGADLTSRVEIPGGSTALTHRGAKNPSETAVSVTHYGTSQRASERMRGARLAVDSAPKLWGVAWRFSAGLDYAAVEAGTAGGLRFVSPSAGLAAVFETAGSQLFVLLRHEPELLTAEVAAFVDPKRPRGSRYRWRDDGDLLPETGEAGELLGRVGGMAHAVDRGLRRPTGNQFALGWRSPRFGPFRATVAGIGRVLLDRFTVRSSGADYQPLVIDDPGGDGLGEARGPNGEPQKLTVWAHQGGGEKDARVVLGNAREPDLYAGAELLLTTVGGSWWFLTLALSGYWDIGGAAFGLHADRNDPGIIDPASADPNLQVNSRGRYDHDRAFGAHLLCGIAPTGWLEGLSAGLVIRYRDGQPMTRILVVEDLPQGPTAVMAVARGDPVPRFTFKLTMDLKLRYLFSHGPLRVAASLEVLNLLGSGTELAENVVTGEHFRRSLEMVPGRTVMLGLEAAWF